MPIKIKKGDKVVFVNPAKHEAHPNWYPSVGTVGIVKCDTECTFLVVKWRDGTTSLDDTWGCTSDDVAPVRLDHTIMEGDM